MSRRLWTVPFVAIALIAFSGALARAVTSTPPAASLDAADAAARPAASPLSDPAVIERGAYLVRTMGCHDCHTPWKDGPQGPEPDMSRALTGHPQDLVLPPPPTLPPGPWMMVGAATNTAYAGPWGVSFTANLTPDDDTGLGTWTAEMFIATMRTGRRQGKGRPILRPIPVQVYGQATDEDLTAIFAYLQSLAPVKNRVPAPVDPPATAQ